MYEPSCDGLLNVELFWIEISNFEKKINQMFWSTFCLGEINQLLRIELNEYPRSSILFARRMETVLALVNGGSFLDVTMSLAIIKDLKSMINWNQFRDNVDEK